LGARVGRGDGVGLGANPAIIKIYGRVGRSSEMYLYNKYFNFFASSTVQMKTYEN
jgi:hypothetical protein